MNRSNLGLRTLATGAAAGAVAVIGIQMIGGKGDSVESASAAGERAAQVTRETKSDRAGRLRYVKTTFPLVAGATTGESGDAFCPKGSQLTGAFGSGFVSNVNGATTLAATLIRQDGNDRDKVADNGVRAVIVNSTGIPGEGTVEAICERAKKKRRR